MEKEITNSLPQICLLCDTRFPNPATLASHVYEIHGIDMMQLAQQNSDANTTNNDKKKKIPNLVKITDLKLKNETSGNYQTISKTVVLFVNFNFIFFRLPMSIFFIFYRPSHFFKVYL